MNDYLKNLKTLAAGIYIFQDLDEEELSLITGIMVPCSCASGQVIMKEGEKGASMFLITAGEVEVNKSLTMKYAEDDFRETEKTLTVLTSADNAVFGEMALVSEDLRSATITTTTGCTLYEINRKNFLDLAASRPALGFKVTLRLAELISKRLKKSSEDVIRLTTALSIALS